MPTKKQSAASRRNGRKSAGPKTPEGKAASSMNALRHGLRARTVVLWDEKQEDFDEIFTPLHDLYQPQNAAERHLVDQAAIAQWKLARAEAYEARACKDDPPIEARIAIFSHMTLVTGRLDRAYTIARKELDRIKAAREKPPEQPQEPARKAQPNEKQAKDKNAAEEQQRDKNLDVFFEDPETGKRDYLYRRRDGKEIPRNESPTPNADQQ